MGGRANRRPPALGACHPPRDDELAALPILLALAAFGALGHFGGWYGGLSGMPSWVTAAATPDPDLATATRNNALATAAALLIGLLGAVIGAGWPRASR